MQEKWEARNLHIIENPPFREQDDFITKYDEFIDQTDTESMESFFRSVAYTFFQYGYEKAVGDLGQAGSDSPVLHLLDRQ